MSDLTPVPNLWGFGLRYYQTPSINKEEAKAEISFIVLFHSQPGLQAGFTMKLMIFSAIHKINPQQQANKINITSTTDSSDCKKKEEK